MAECLVRQDMGDTQIPGRRVIKEIVAADVLLETHVPMISECAVVRTNADEKAAGHVGAAVGVDGDVVAPYSRRLCRGLGHTVCDKCYVPDGRYGRNKRCVRACAVTADGTWGPTKCNERCRPCDIADHG